MQAGNPNNPLNDIMTQLGTSLAETGNAELLQHAIVEIGKYYVDAWKEIEVKWVDSFWGAVRECVQVHVGTKKTVTEEGGGLKAFLLGKTKQQIVEEVLLSNPSPHCVKLVEEAKKRMLN